MTRHVVLSESSVATIESKTGRVISVLAGSAIQELKCSMCGNTIPMCMCSDVCRVSGSCHEVFIVAYVVNSCGVSVHPVALLATYPALHQKARVEANSSIDNRNVLGERAVL